MYIIGITGGTGAGKTTAVKVLQDQGALILNCDEIYHRLLVSDKKMIAIIKDRFQNITTNGAINRRKLADLVFNDPAALEELNKITHTFVSNEVDSQIATFKAQGGTLVAIDAIALIESGQNKKCDTVVGVIAPENSRISRIKKRDELTNERVQKRVNAQQPESYYIENCDHILENTYSTPAEFKEKCIEFFTELLSKQ